MPGNYNTSVSDILKNASFEEYKIMCSAITGFIQNSERPQILVLDNEKVNEILLKYGLVEVQSGKITSVHPELGDLQFYQYAGAGQDPVPYIDPSSRMDEINDKNKKNGLKENTSSPFDVITGPALSAAIIENEKKFKEAIFAAWEDRSLIQKVTRDKDGNIESVQFWTVDPYLTNDLEKRASEQAEETGERVRVRTQYTVVVPPDASIPTNNSTIANAIVGPGVDGLGTSPTSASPTAELSANFNACQIISDDLGNQNANHKPFSSAYALNSIGKKTSKLLDTLMEIPDAFSEEFTSNWGGIFHNSKTFTESLGRLYNYGLGLGFIARGLVYLSSGETEKAEKDLSTGGKLIATESLWSPTTSYFVSEVVESIIPRKPLTGRNAFFGEEFVSLRETEDGQKALRRISGQSPDTPPEDLRIPRRPIIDKKTAPLIEMELNNINRAKTTTTPIKYSAEAIIAAAKYLAPLFGWEDIRTVDDLNKRINSAQESVGTEGQIGIYIQSNNTVEIDSGKIEAINPDTGKIQEIDLPFSVCYPPVLVQDLSRQLLSSSPLISSAPLLPFYAELDVPDKIKLGMVRLSERIGIIDSNYPIHQQAASAISTIDAASEGSSVKFVQKINKWFKSATMREIASTLRKGPLNAIWLVYKVLPPTLEEFNAEYLRRVEEIKRRCPGNPGAIYTKEKCDELLKQLEEDRKKALEENGIKDNLSRLDIMKPDEDPFLDSDVNLSIEVETAKNHLNRYKGLLSALSNVGDMLEQNTVGVPVTLSTINQNVSFVTDIYNDPRPYQEQDGGGNAIIPIGCFPSYVSLKTNEGYKKISEIKVGDSIISFNDRGELEEDIVSNTFVYDDKEVYRYYISNNSFVDVTKEHPVLTLENTFEEIGKLNVGDYLIDIHNSPVRITSIEFLNKDRVYNIEVKNNHTYIAENIRVHNKTKEPIGRRPIFPISLVISSEFEDYWKEFLDWLDETFPGVLQDGWPVQQEYPEVPGVGPETTGGGEPTSDPPYPGPPQGGTPTPQEGPIAIEPGGVLPNVPLEIIFNLPDPILDPDGYMDALKRAGINPT